MAAKFTFNATADTSTLSRTFVFRAGGPFPFMKLPAELRNQVYEYMIINAKSYCRTNAKPTVVTTDSPMAQVSKKARREIMGVLGASIAITIGPVYNLEFGPVLRTLSHIKRMDGLRQIAGATWIIALRVSEPRWNKDDFPEAPCGLEQWVRFLMVIRRARGWQKVSYTATGTVTDLQLWRHGMKRSSLKFLKDLWAAGGHEEIKKDISNMRIWEAANIWGTIYLAARQKVDAAHEVKR